MGRPCRDDGRSGIVVFPMPDAGADARQLKVSTTVTIVSASSQVSSPGRPAPDSVLLPMPAVDITTRRAGMRALVSSGSGITMVPPVMAGVTLLLRTTFPMTHEDFHCTDAALRGRLHEHGDWSHPDGPDLIAWTHTVGRSPVVYLQPGDGPSSYADPHVRRLLDNAVHFVADRSPFAAR